MIFVVGFVVRLTYALLAPLSIDWFALYIGGVSAYESPGAYFGIYTLPIYLYAALYSLWLHIPIVHPDVFTIVTFPGIGGVAPYYNPTPDAIVFVLVMKLPSLISDLLTAWLIYRILSADDVSKGRILFAVSAWLLNPLTMIMSNYNGVDPLATLLVLFAAYCAKKNSLGLTSISLAVGGLLRLIPFLVLPFFLVKSVRARDLRSTLSLALPAIFIVGGAVMALYIAAPSAFAQLLGGRPGLTVPEAIDVFGANLAQQGVQYPDNALQLTLLAYVILLWILTEPARRAPGPILLGLAPLLAYAAFSWSFAPLLMYVLPLAFIQVAISTGQRGLTFLFTITAFLWCVVRSGDYFFGPSVIFYYPLYTQSAQDLGTQLLAGWQLLHETFQPQVRGAFTAVLMLLMFRLIRSART